MFREYGGVCNIRPSINMIKDSFFEKTRLMKVHFDDVFVFGLSIIKQNGFDLQLALLFSLTLFGQISTWLFLRYVEAPHMRNLYGAQVRPKAGAFKVVGKVGTDAVNSVVKKFELEGIIEKVKDIIPSSRFSNNPALSSGALKTLTRQNYAGNLLFFHDKKRLMKVQLDDVFVFSW